MPSTNRNAWFTPCVRLVKWATIYYKSHDFHKWIWEGAKIYWHVHDWSWSSFGSSGSDLLTFFKNFISNIFTYEYIPKMSSTMISTLPFYPILIPNTSPGVLLCDKNIYTWWFYGASKKFKNLMISKKLLKL